MATLTFNPVSMLNRIKQAESLLDLASLAREGAAYEYAADKTRQRWEKASIIRQKELSQVEEKSDPKPVGKTNKKSTGKKGK